MGRRGPKSFGSSHQSFPTEQEWLWFFSGLRDGFPEEVSFEWVIPKPPHLQTHPILLDELKKKPLIITRKERTSIGFLPEKRTWLKLLSSKTVRDVRKACKDSRYWVRQGAKVQDFGIYYYLTLLCDQLAPVFLAAKQENRFPKSARLTSDDRRMRFLARAMAGACRGVKPRYANDEFNHGRIGARSRNVE